jgi:ABC-type branched-subunit amino acid transport system ATPase component
MIDFSKKGLLRLLAILSQTMTDNKILLFDEIEDGINPEIVEKLVDL